MSVIRNTASNLGAALVPVVVSLLTVPAYIAHLGEERYGVMALIAMLLGYFGVFDFGLSTATAQRIAATPADDPAARRRVFWTAMAANVAMGTLGALLIFPAAWYFASHGMKAPAALLPEIQAAVVWLVLALPVMLLTGVLRGALQGAGQFSAMNLANVIAVPLSQFLPLLAAIWISPSLTVVLPVLYASRAIVLLWYLLIVVRRVTQGWHLVFDRGEARSLISFGGWMTLSGLVSPLIAGLDRFLIGTMIGVRQVSHYSVPYQLVERGMFVPAALLQALFPRITAAPDEAESRALSRRGLYAVAAICAPPMVLAAVFIHPFLALWISTDFAQSASLIGQVILAGFWINALGYACYNHLTATGRPRLLATAHVIELVPYCVVLVALMAWLGLIGAALAFAVRVAADDLLLAYFCGLLAETALLIVAGTAVFALAIWLGVGLDLHDTVRVASGLLLTAATGGVSLIWLRTEKDSLTAALRFR